MSKFQITSRDPRALNADPRNVVIHPEKQLRQIGRSIQSFGFLVPVLVDGHDRILSGHGRVEAAKLVGLESIPTIRVEHLSEAQKRAFMIADNRLAKLSVWDERKLALELEELQVLDLDFEITDTGFEIGEIDRLITDCHEEPGEDAADQPVDLKAIRPVARRGDLWALGKHRLFCGDALDPHSYAILLDRERAQMCFMDPPYNVRINGHVSGKGRARHAEFEMASGELSPSEFTLFLAKAFERAAAASENGSIHFVCMDGQHLRELLNAAADVYSAVKNVCVWDKGGGGGMGSLYRSQVEFIAVFKCGGASSRNNVQLGRFGRSRSTLWKYPGLNSFQKDRAKTLAMHPTVKPVALVADTILDCSNPKEIVLDPFAGSGTTLIAAERTGRRGFGMELDPHYVDVALHRFREVTGVEPINLCTGRKLGDAGETRPSGPRLAPSSAWTSGEGCD